MSVTLGELLQMVPPETEQKVASVISRYNRTVRDLLRREMALRLSLSEESEATKERSGTSVPVHVVPGYPIEYRDIVVPEEYRLSLMLAPLRADLVNFIRSGKKIVDNLPDITPRHILDTVDMHFPHSLRAATELLAIIDKYDPIKLWFDPPDSEYVPRSYILDFLGVYRYRAVPKGSEKVDARIELYWGPIGLCAASLGVSVEGLTLKVLAHELAHAYSHLGYDIDGRRWTNTGFGASDRAVVEGLAQYYAHRTVAEMSGRAPEGLDAYRKLVPRQPPPYQTHERWEKGVDGSGGFTPEEVRLAMVATRRLGAVQLDAFEQQLGEARGNLRQVSRS